MVSIKEVKVEFWLLQRKVKQFLSQNIRHFLLHWRKTTVLYDSMLPTLRWIIPLTQQVEVKKKKKDQYIW